MQHGAVGHLNGRVINGFPINIESAPYQVSLESRYQHSCGGSLISPLIVLTAAHCLIHVTTPDMVLPFELMVRTGANHANTEGTVRFVRKVVINSRYIMQPDSSDIGLILLDEPVEVSPKTAPIALSTIPPADGELALITGYGSQNVQFPRKLPAGRLMGVQLPVVPRDKCYNIMLKLGQIVATDMLCAGFESDHRDACKGDSGGPMAIDGRLVGITAWGVGCGQKGLPGIYTSVAHHIGWILYCTKQLADEGFCDQTQAPFIDN